MMCKNQEYRTMQQKRDRGIPERVGEKSVVSGNNFWHSVYKGIEGSSPKPRAAAADLPPQAPLDYVEDPKVADAARGG